MGERTVVAFLPNVTTRFPSGALIVVFGLGLVAPGTAARDLPTLPDCTDQGADHSRQGMKTRAAPPALTVSASHQIHVSDMSQWRVPVGIASADRDSDNPLAPRERDAKLLALTGFGRVGKLETDCDFHVQVAQSEEANRSLRSQLRLGCAQFRAEELARRSSEGAKARRPLLLRGWGRATAKRHNDYVRLPSQGRVCSQKRPARQ